jgi:hypothetical protein
LPIVAFGIDDGPPIVLFNHADHVFWLGASVADIVADLRPLGHHLSTTRRGVRDSEILPVPLSNPTMEPSREVARRQLCIGSDTTVLLTISAEERYLPFAEYDFLGTITKVMQRNPKAVLIAVGPKRLGRWAQSSELVGNRIRPMGRCTDLSSFYASADLYLPSFPLGGLTALLEAGLRGIPVLGLYFSEAPHLCGADDLALEGLSTHAPTIRDYMAEIEQMIANPALRHERGRMLQEQVRKTHAAPGWKTFLETILRSLPNDHKVKLPSPSASIQQGDLLQAGLDAAVAPGYTLSTSYFVHGSHLPLTKRVNASLSLLARALSEPETTSTRLLLEAGRIAYPLLPSPLRPIVEAASAPFVSRIRRS